MAVTDCGMTWKLWAHPLKKRYDVCGRRLFTLGLNMWFPMFMLHKISNFLSQQVITTKRVEINSALRVILSKNHLNFNREEQYYCKVEQPICFRFLPFIALFYCFTLFCVAQMEVQAPNRPYRILLSWDYFTVGERQESEDW